MSPRVRIHGPGLRRVLCGYGLYALLGERRPSVGCPFRMLTGRPCPACGLTGAVAVALRGRFRRSAARHPLGPAVAVAVMIAAAATVAPFRSWGTGRG